MPQDETHGHITPERLRSWVTEVLSQAGLPVDDAGVAAQVLVDADLTGRHTHGVSRLPLYVGRIEAGLIEAHPPMEWCSEKSPSMGHLDGGNGLGPVVAWRAMERGIELARQYGSAFVAVHHSNHAGAMSVYCHEAARQGFILMALTNSPPGIPPWGGRKAYLGTNPIAWGFPRGPGKVPLVIDLATSLVARGNIIEAARLGRPIPEGWAIDKEGHPTTDAKAALEGAVLPMAGAKGYALALIVEILSGVLAGAGFGPGVKNPYSDHTGPSDVGHFFMVLDPSHMMPLETFLARLEMMEEEIRESPPAPNQAVSLPGDRSERQREWHQEHGVPLDRALVEQLNQLGSRLNVSSL